VLGVSAGLLLIVGLLRVFYFEKGRLYYFSSHAFLTKFAVLIIAFLSTVPTVEFLSWRKEAGQVPVADAKRMRLVGSLIHANFGDRRFETCQDFPPRSLGSRRAP
jgi:putative membrane protein